MNSISNIIVVLGLIQYVYTCGGKIVVVVVVEGFWVFQLKHNDQYLIYK